MPTLSSITPIRRLLALVLAITTLAAVLLAFVMWRGSPDPSHPIHSDVPSIVVGPPVTPAPQGQLAALTSTRAPETFARDIAGALFAFDTATLVTRDDHVTQLVAVADPSGESAPGLVADLDNYFPTPPAWTQLAEYETRQWLVIDTAVTPSKWAEAEAQAGDQLLPGTTAFTIRGTRHRAGIWEGEPVTSEHPVAFTVFIVCGPSYPQCHLLRLSLPDKPLE